MSKKLKQLKLLVIGSSVVDKIDYSGRTEIKPGGIFYTVLALENIKDEDDRIDLITYISKTTFGLFSDVYNSINMNFARYAENIGQVRLSVNKDGTRTETFELTSENLIFDEKINYDIYDGILINMISGNDINLSQLKFLRKSFHGKIYCDIHSLSRKLNSSGEMQHTTITECNEWLENIDIIQVNEFEFNCLFDFSDMDRIIDKVFSYNISALIITKAEQGAEIYYRINNKVHKELIEAIDVNSVNFVGCGDVFGAVYFYNYIKTENIHSSFLKANIAAGKSTEFQKVNEYNRLKSLIRDYD
jgi:sugar/nucleoside kinase (ribokinase family)